MDSYGLFYCMINASKESKEIIQKKNIAKKLFSYKFKAGYIFVEFINQHHTSYDPVINTTSCYPSVIIIITTAK